MAVKRILDIVLAVVGTIVLSPVLIILGILVKLTSKGSILYCQTRVGRNGKLFKIFKFRTMISGADKKGLSITVGGDSRITKVGRFLRKTKMDELPQFFNILLGQMSFVGPRPEVERYVDMYSQEQREVLKIRPGITDYASICFRNESEILARSDDPEREYIENIMPMKIKYNLKYVREMGVITDIKIIFLTFWSILGGKIKIDESRLG